MFIFFQSVSYREWEEMGKSPNLPFGKLWPYTLNPPTHWQQNDTRGIKGKEVGKTKKEREGEKVWEAEIKERGIKQQGEKKQAWLSLNITVVHTTQQACIPHQSVVIDEASWRRGTKAQPPPYWDFLLLCTVPHQVMQMGFFFFFNRRQSIFTFSVFQASCFHEQQNN